MEEIFMRQSSNPQLIKNISFDVWRWEIKKRIQCNRTKFLFLLVFFLIFSIIWKWSFLLLIGLIFIVLLIDLVDTFITFDKLSKIDKSYKEGYIVKYGKQGLSYNYDGKFENIINWNRFKNIVEFTKKGVFVIQDYHDNYHLFFSAKTSKAEYQRFKVTARNEIKKFWR